MNRITATCITAIIAGSLLSSNIAFAQNALGDGRGLEKDMRKNGTGNTPRKNFREEVNRRNALITGEIGGSKAFRGNAGYLGPTDFRAATAGDSSFGFRRDAMSARAVSNAVQGGESLRLQYTYAIGNSRIIERDGGSVISSRSSNSLRNPPADRFSNQDQGSLRMTSLFVANRNLRPSMVTRRQTISGEIESVEASRLLGIKRIPSADKYANTRQDLDASTRVENRGAYDGIRQKLDLFAGEREADKPETEKSGDGSVSTPNESPVQRKQWEKLLEELKPKINDSGDQPTDGKADRKPTVYEPGEWRRKRDEDPKDDGPKFDDRTLDLIRAAGGVVENFGFQDQIEGDPFTAYMAGGQRLLASERYFEAEEKFSRALAYKPGEPMALVGRIHSQIGAGLHMSAAINVQDFFTNNPELINVRYSGEAGLPPARLTSQRDELRVRAATAAAGSVTSRDAALLWAYLSHQAGDLNDACQALDVFMREASARDTNFGLLLRELWSRSSATPATPPPTPATNQASPSTDTPSK